MEPTFKKKLFIIWIIAIHLVVYIIWAFVALSFTEPIITTFATRESRGFFAVFILLGTLMGGPIWCPFE